jgi:hypothetical protein
MAVYVVLSEAVLSFRKISVCCLQAHMIAHRIVAWISALLGPELPI